MCFLPSLCLLILTLHSVHTPQTIQPHPTLPHRPQSLGAHPGRFQYFWFWFLFWFWFDFLVSGGLFCSALQLLLLKSPLLRSQGKLKCHNGVLPERTGPSFSSSPRGHSRSWCSERMFTPQPWLRVHFWKALAVRPSSGLSPGLPHHHTQMLCFTGCLAWR